MIWVLASRRISADFSKKLLVEALLNLKKSSPKLDPFVNPRTLSISHGSVMQILREL